MPDERTAWDERYRNGLPRLTVPNAFLAEAYAQFVETRFPQQGAALDLAGGAGRHAIWLAERGWQVTMLDISREGLAAARKSAGPLAARIQFFEQDLREFHTGRQYDLVLVFYYLERSILPQLERSLSPGGLLLYKTYVRDDRKPVSKHTNPAHLLEPGELLHAFPGLRVLHHRESTANRAVAELVAQKP